MAEGETESDDKTPVTFSFEMVKTGSAILGITVLYNSSDAWSKMGVIVREVLENGLVATWNSQSFEPRVVLQGDLIFQVNDVHSDTDAMVKEMKTKSRVRLHIEKKGGPLLGRLSAELEIPVKTAAATSLPCSSPPVPKPPPLPPSPASLKFVKTAAATSLPGSSPPVPKPPPLPPSPASLKFVGPWRYNGPDVAGGVGSPETARLARKSVPSEHPSPLPAELPHSRLCSAISSDRSRAKPVPPPKCPPPSAKPPAPPPLAFGVPPPAPPSALDLMPPAYVPPPAMAHPRARKGRAESSGPESGALVIPVSLLRGRHATVDELLPQLVKPENLPYPRRLAPFLPGQASPPTSMPVFRKRPGPPQEGNGVDAWHRWQ